VVDASKGRGGSHNHAALRDLQHSSLLSPVALWVHSSHVRWHLGHALEACWREAKHTWHTSGWHRARLAWGCTLSTVGTLHHLHLLLNELRLQELDLLLLIHHDVLVHQLLLLWSHLGHAWGSAWSAISWITHHHWVAHHACKTGQELVHGGSLLRIRCGVYLSSSLGRGRFRVISA